MNLEEKLKEKSWVDDTGWKPLDIITVEDAISITKQYAKEMYEKAKEDCGDRVAYRGEISKVEAWSLSTDELQDRCEELCLSTPLPKELQNGK